MDGRRRACPQIAAQPVARPVFVLGLPQTGTTLLHDLLAAVPGHRAPKVALLTNCHWHPAQLTAVRRARSCQTDADLPIGLLA